MNLLNSTKRWTLRFLGYLFASPSERNSRKFVDNLCSMLEEDLTPETVEQAKNWLENNSQDWSVRMVICKLLQVAGNEDMIDYCLAWAQRYPQSTDAALDQILSYSPTERVLTVVSERLDIPDNSRTRGYLLRTYLRKAPLEEARRKSLDWIKANPNRVGAGSVFSFLIQHSPTDAGLAREWLAANMNRPEGIEIITALVKIGDELALELAKGFLTAKYEKGPGVTTIRFLSFEKVIKSIAHSFPDELQSQWMQDWVNDNVEHDDLAMLASALLDDGRPSSDQSVAFARHVLELKPHSKWARHIITGLLDARGDDESIKLGKKALVSDPNDTSLMCVLLRAVQDKETISAAKRWIGKHPTDPESVFLLNHLSEQAHDDEIIKWLKVWLKANPNNTNLPGVLSYYVRARSDIELIALTKQYLGKPLRQEQFVWLIRSLLKMTPKDPFGVGKAKEWLETNGTYSERGSEASLTNEGKVLSALLDAEPDQYVVDKAKTWLAKNPADMRVLARVREKLAKYS